MDVASVHGLKTSRSIVEKEKMNSGASVDVRFEIVLGMFEEMRLKKAKGDVKWKDFFWDWVEEVNQLGRDLTDVRTLDTSSNSVPRGVYELDGPAGEALEKLLRAHNSAARTPHTSSNSTSTEIPRRWPKRRWD